MELLHIYILYDQLHDDHQNWKRSHNGVGGAPTGQLRARARDAVGARRNMFCVIAWLPVGAASYHIQHHVVSPSCAAQHQLALLATRSRAAVRMEEVCVEVQDSQRWVERVVMGLNLCPWARPVKASIRYVHTDADALGLYDAALKPELDLMAADSTVETTVVVAPNAPSDFASFERFLAGVETLMMMQALSTQFQIVGFHPEFQFGVSPHTPWDGVAAEDPAHFTNRSPHPMVHLLRQASVNTAAQSYKGARSVSETNEQLLRGLGTAELERLRTAGDGQ